MTPVMVALSVISTIVFLGSAIGFMARFRHTMDLEQWTVAGRGFGLLLVWLLMAGECFTVFTFLGGSGWAYSKGGPVLYILSYAPLACVAAFYILPALWRVGERHKLQTQADFFHVRYGSKHLGALVALIGVISLIPYVQMQLVGLGMVVEVASYGTIPRTLTMIVAFTLVAAFVLVSGVRGVAWVSIVKDVLLLIAAVFLGLVIPYIYFGGLAPMFHALAQAKPEHLVLPGATKNLGHSWFISTVLLTSLGFYMWPHYFAAVFTAKGANVLRRNAMLMPLYIVAMPLVIFVGFAALLVMPGLQNGDLSLLLMVQKTFPAWVLGFIGGAGALTAMVPSAIQLLAGATLYAKNLYRPLFAPDMTDDEVASLAKTMVVVLTLGALLLAIYTHPSLVSLLLLGTIGVSQLLPGVLFGLFWKRATASGVLAGLIVGIAVGVSLVLSGNDPYKGLNAGLIALVLNAVVSTAVSLSAQVRVSAFDEVLPGATFTSGEAAD